ncbi:hypothetical protein ACFLU5_02790 [Bacteroidota bacterium]
MKKLISQVTVIVISMMVLQGCQKSAPEITDAEKKEIEESVRNVFNKITEAVNTHDVDGLMDHYWNHEDFVFVRYGKVMDGFISSKICHAFRSQKQCG